MASPEVTVQMAFGDDPGAASFTWTTIHDGANPSAGKVRSLTYQRGRQNELNRTETGTGTVLLSDADSDFDPDNPDGAYYPNIRPYVPVRARATINSVTYELCQLFVERWPRTMRRRGYTERSVGLVDGFEWLARAGLAGQAYSQEASGTRVGNALDDAGWPAGRRDIDAGQDLVAALTVAASDDTKALSHLLEVAEEQGENGLLFINAAGQIVFIERHALLKTPYTTSQVTFHDADSTGDYPFADATPSYDLDSTFNQWSGTRAGGVTQTVEDATSQSRYGLRSKQVTSLLTADSIVLNLMQYKLAQFGNPLNRIESITVKPGNNTAFWQAVLGLEVGERITVAETPPGFAAQMETDYVIQSIKASFATGPTVSASFTFGLWPATTTQFWSAGDAANSLAGVSTRAAY